MTACINTLAVSPHDRYGVLYAIRKKNRQGATGFGMGAPEAYYIKTSLFYFAFSVIGQALIPPTFLNYVCSGSHRVRWFAVMPVVA